MEININCDLGEKSKHHSNKYDPELLGIVNSANIACGYHAGDEDTMRETIKISKKNGVSIGAHPSFNDPENFGRKRINLSSAEIEKLIQDQYNILQAIAQQNEVSVSHIKPHGALNNMACEDIELATVIAKTIYKIDNFMKIESWGVNSIQNKKSLIQNKGQKECVKAFLNSIKFGKPSPIPIQEIFEVHRWLFKLQT